MTLPGLESLQQKVEDLTQFISWLAGHVYARNWVVVLTFCFVLAAALFNPKSIKALDLPEDFLPAWYSWVYWAVWIVFF